MIFYKEFRKGVDGPTLLNTGFSFQSGLAQWAL